MRMSGLTTAGPWAEISQAPPMQQDPKGGGARAAVSSPSASGTLEGRGGKLEDRDAEASPLERERLALASSIPLGGQIAGTI